VSTPPDGSVEEEAMVDIKETLASMNFCTTNAYKISSRAFLLSLAFTSAIFLIISKTDH
jgi:hypothetical protein